VPFYTAYLPYVLNGRINNLEYGSYAPGGDQKFIDDRGFVRLWSQPKRVFIITYAQDRKHLENLIGSSRLCPVIASGGKELLTNSPLN
jgi:hypothetical protein